MTRHPAARVPGRPASAAADRQAQCVRRVRRVRGERGESVAALLVATAFALTAFVGFVDVLTVAYARSMLRFVVDDSARAGSRYGAGRPDCERRAAESRRDLLGGAMGARVRVVCAETRGTVTASAEGEFPAWLPGLPAWQVRVSASSVRERA